jgi:hypothetical protein
MSKPNELTVQEFADIVATELEAFVKKELKHQKESPEDYIAYDDDDQENQEPKFTAWFWDWLDIFSNADTILPENKKKIGE